MGTLSVSACLDDRSSQPDPPFEETTLVVPAPRSPCNKPEDFPLPECQQPAPVLSGGSHGSGGSVFVVVNNARTAHYGPATPGAQRYALARVTDPIQTLARNGTALARAIATTVAARPTPGMGRAPAIRSAGLGVTGRAISSSSSGG